MTCALPPHVHKSMCAPKSFVYCVKRKAARVGFAAWQDTSSVVPACRNTSLLAVPPAGPVMPAGGAAATGLLWATLQVHACMLEGLCWNPYETQHNTLLPATTPLSRCPRLVPCSLLVVALPLPPASALHHLKHFATTYIPCVLLAMCIPLTSAYLQQHFLAAARTWSDRQWRCHCCLHSPYRQGYVRRVHAEGAMYKPL